MLSKNISLLKWFNFLTEFKLFTAISIIYFTEVSGSFVLGMSIFSIAMISSAVFEIPTGVFSDYIGRKKTMIFGSCFYITGILFYAIGSSYYFLAIGAIMEGIARSFYSGNNNAFLYDILRESDDEKNFNNYLGKTDSMFQLAIAISSIVGGFIAAISLSLVFWLSVIPQLGCFAVSILFQEPKVQSKKDGNIYKHLKEAAVCFLKNKKLRLLSIQSIIGSSVGDAKFQFQSAFFQMLWPVWAIGLARAVSGFFAFCSYWFSGKIIKKYKPLNILISLSFFNRIANIIAAAFPTIASPAIITTLSLGYGVGQISQETLMQSEFNNHQRATMGSLNSFAGSFLFGIIAIFVGYIADKLTPSIAIIISQLVLFVTIPILWKLFKIDEKEKKFYNI